MKMNLARFALFVVGMCSLPSISHAQLRTFSGAISFSAPFNPGNFIQGDGMTIQAGTSISLANGFRHYAVNGDQTFDLKLILANTNSVMADIGYTESADLEVNVKLFPNPVGENLNLSLHTHEETT